MSWIVRIDGAVERKSLGCLSMITPRCGGMFTARSISPFCSAATRTASSGMGRKTTVLTCGAPRQYASLASRTSSSSFDQRTNLYGPVPMGFFEKSAVSFPADSLGGSIPLCGNVITGTNVGQGFFVCTRIVYGSTISTRSIGAKKVEPRSLPCPCPNRSRVNLAESALNSSPLWNLTPLRSLTSQADGGMNLGISVARLGTIFRLGSRSYSVSKMWRQSEDRSEPRNDLQI